MVSFIGGGNWSTWSRSLTCHKSLINFITLCYIKYTSPWAGFKFTLLVIGTDCIGSYKSNYHKIMTIIAPSFKGTTNLLRYFRRQYFWEIQWKRCMQIRIHIFYIQWFHGTAIVLFVPGKYDGWYVWLLITFHLGFHLLQAKFVVLLLFFLILSLFLLGPQVSLHTDEFLTFFKLLL